MAARRPRRRKETPTVELNDLRAQATTPGYTLTEDVVRTLEDGRQELVGRKGQTIPIATAQRLGLVPAPGAAVETKATTPAPKAARVAPKADEKAPKADEQAVKVEDALGGSGTAGAPRASGDGA